MESQGVKEPHTNDLLKPGQTDGIEIIFYTDPLCCWSWAMQRQWQRLLDEYNGSFRVTYKMAGLLPSWRNFNDPVNSIRKPIQMGPEWMHAAAVSGATINSQIWFRDPPSSSFPACIAVKCAELQSPAAGARYLHLLREAVMVRNLNIARTSVLLELVSTLSDADKTFNSFKFRHDLFSEEGRTAFTKDWQECKYMGITRLPTLIFRSADHPAILLSGYQTYDSLKNAAIKMEPAIGH
jgi:putative protein-disulfide isomerase